MECNGYWYECSCKDCEKAKDLYEDIEFHWDNKEMQKEIARELESMGYSI